MIVIYETTRTQPLMMCVPRITFASVGTIHMPTSIPTGHHSVLRTRRIWIGRALFRFFRSFGTLVSCAFTVLVLVLILAAVVVVVVIHCWLHRGGTRVLEEAMLKGNDRSTNKGVTMVTHICLSDVVQCLLEPQGTFTEYKTMLLDGLSRHQMSSPCCASSVVVVVVVIDPAEQRLRRTRRKGGSVGVRSCSGDTTAVGGVVVVIVVVLGHGRTVVAFGSQVSQTTQSWAGLPG